MKKSIIYLCACAISGMMLTTSCQDNLDLDTANSDTRWKSHTNLTHPGKVF